MVKIGDQNVNILIDQQVGQKVTIQVVEAKVHQLVQFQVLLRLVLHCASKDITRRTPFTSMLVQKDGPRMPLAIVRLQAKEFTCTIFI